MNSEEMFILVQGNSNVQDETIFYDFQSAYNNLIKYDNDINYIMQINKSEISKKLEILKEGEFINYSDYCIDILDLSKLNKYKSYVDDILFELSEGQSKMLKFAIYNLEDFQNLSKNIKIPVNRCWDYNLVREIENSDLYKRVLNDIIYYISVDYKENDNGYSYKPLNIDIKENQNLDLER